MTAAEGRLVYVVPHLSEDETEHFAHLPGLLAALGSRTDVAVAVERGTPPAHLPGVRLLVRVPGRRRVARLLGSALTIRRCARAGYGTYFLRYSRLFLLALILTYPLYRHRILLWRSGLPDVYAPEAGRTLRHRLDAALSAAVVPFVHALVTGPESMVPVMARRWRVPPHRMLLLYNDVDNRRFAPPTDARRTATRAALGLAPDEFVVLFVHRLSYRKGVRLLAPLLDAVSAGSPVRLVVAGDGPERGSLERQAAQRGGRLRLLGAVPNRELPGWYGAADCVLVPSYEEGFSRVLLEAMATATPVVTTDAGGSADVVGPGYPFVVPVGDLDGLAAAVRAVMSMPEAERRALGQRLRHRAQQNFSPERVAAMLRELL